MRKATKQKEGKKERPQRSGNKKMKGEERREQTRILAPADRDRALAYTINRTAGEKGDQQAGE